MDTTKICRDELLKLAKEKKIYLEGNILKILKADSGDIKFEEYLKTCKKRDVESRRKRLNVTKQVQKQNKDLESAAKENNRVNKQLSKALDEASKSAEEARLAEEIANKLKEEAEKGMGKALEDLELMQKKTQFELVSTIVRIALAVIIGVGIITSIMYGIAIVSNYDTQIIGSTWSNMFGILLTNAFSIVGTIMGVKYASEKE
jgi:Fe2+ transport system protein B